MDLRNLDLKMEPMSFDGVILSNVLDVMPKDISTTVIDDLERVLKPGGYWFIKMNPYYSKEELESFEYKNAGNNIYEKDHIMRLRQATTKLLERKICTFWERDHIFGIRIPVAGGNEPSVCLPELKVPEDSQQEAGY